MGSIWTTLWRLTENGTSINESSSIFGPRNKNFRSLWPLNRPVGISRGLKMTIFRDSQWYWVYTVINTYSTILKKLVITLQNAINKSIKCGFLGNLGEQKIKYWSKTSVRSALVSRRSTEGPNGIVKHLLKVK